MNTGAVSLQAVRGPEHLTAPRYAERGRGEPMSMLIYAAFPVFVLTMLIEAAWAKRAQAAGAAVRGYRMSDTATSLSLGVINVLVSAAAKLVLFGVSAWLYEARVVDLPAAIQGAGLGAVGVWVALWWLEDLCYYANHRAHHEVRVLWAAHVNHHSSTFYNLSTALRQSWSTPFTGFIFWAPLPLLGFEPAMILTQQAISLLYQYWLHTEAIVRMPAWFEAVFNTPSHHRAHHGRNPLYLDRNHGGILIVWDRLFGTFEPEGEPVDYGLTRNLDTDALVTAATHEWAAWIADLRSARSLREVVGFTFGPPGWRPETLEHTAAAVRAAARRALG